MIENYYWSHCAMDNQDYSHLSKYTSGCKQKCTLFLKLFFSPIFHALSHSVIRLMVWSTFWLVESQLQPIIVVKAKALSKMDHTKGKAIKNLVRKWCQKLCTILFKVTLRFGKNVYQKHSQMNYWTLESCWDNYDLTLLHLLKHLSESKRQKDKVQHSYFDFNWLNGLRN